MGYKLSEIDALMADDDDEEAAAPAASTLSDADAEVYGVAAGELRAFIERAERLAAEKAEIAEQEKEVFAEAKGRGYDVKVLRKVIAIRKRNRDEVAEEDAILEMYMAALGMA